MSEQPDAAASANTPAAGPAASAPAPNASAPASSASASNAPASSASASNAPASNAPASSASASNASVPAAHAAGAPGAAPASPDERVLQKDDPSSWTELEKGIVAALKTVFDPEIPVDIWELGLIYKVATASDGHVDVDMTLTSPMCPEAERIPPEVQRKVSSVPGVMAANVDVVWEPPWTPACMSEAARFELNIPS